MIVRPETPADFPAIATVVEAAFGKPREARMVEAIRASDGYVSELALVAEETGEIVGHTMLSYVSVQGADHRLLQLAPMAVAPRWQRQGVGGRLVRAALTAAEDRGEVVVLVLGHPEYYPRFGFRPASELGLLPPVDGIPYGVWMAVVLRSFDPALAGRVVAPPAFAPDRA